MIHNAIRSSLLKFCTTFVSSVTTGYTTSFVDLDSHGQLYELPENDIVAMNGFSWMIDENIIEVICQFGISTVNDPNLFRHSTLINDLSSLLLPEKKITYIDPTTGAVLGWMVVTNGTVVHPMTKTNPRVFQFVEVTLLTDRTGA